ncbi:putative uncharacterized protein DDB_G0286901 [Protopterus annectens]|uniref:putative uncharacterized protein DDB_G0286901 n=1 Tax=Protopterus annectens TaxID=7888 RepID=UPI001CFBBA13|nr:putative uncharacterized protein DDB_G0286901 [Protopterus annectens]
MLQIIIDQYILINKNLEQHISQLDCQIKQHADFLRYKYEYIRCFHSIEQHIEKIRHYKLKKLQRDQKQYPSNTARPAPPKAQFPLDLGLSGTNNTMEENMTNEIYEGNISSNEDEEPSTSADLQDNNGEVRKSERIKARNNNKNNNNHNDNFRENQQNSASYSRQGFPRRNQKRNGNWRKNNKNRR